MLNDIIFMIGILFFAVFIILAVVIIYFMEKAERYNKERDKPGYKSYLNILSFPRKTLFSKYDSTGQKYLKVSLKLHKYSILAIILSLGFYVASYLLEHIGL
jgi:hypothetical protein